MEPFLWHANSGDYSEKVTSLPCYIGAPWKVVFSVPLPPLNIGDLVEAHTTFEITNDLRVTTEIVKRMIIATGPLALSGIELSEASGRNVPSPVHHDTVVDNGTWKATAALTGRYLNVLCKAQTPNGEGTVNNVVWLEQDYGRTFVKVYDAAALKKWPQT